MLVLFGVADVISNCMILLQSRQLRKIMTCLSCFLLRKRKWGKNKGRQKLELRK